MNTSDLFAYDFIEAMQRDEVVSQGFDAEIEEEAKLRSWRADALHNPVARFTPERPVGRQWYPSDGYQRDRVVFGLCWSLPTEEAIHRIRAFAPEGVVDIGAGYGLWVYLMAQAQIPVVGFDVERSDWLTDEYPRWAPIRYDLTHTEAARWAAAMGRALFMSWPPFDTPMASESLRVYLKHGGRKLIYVGEGQYGCTGDEPFHRRLKTARDSQYHGIPTWSGIRDLMALYTW